MNESNKKKRIRDPLRNPPSFASVEVLALAERGWQIGRDISIMGGGRAWQQEGGISRGGRCRDIHGSTFSALRKRGLIRQIDSPSAFPIVRYEVTDEGRRAIAKRDEKYGLAERRKT